MENVLVYILKKFWIENGYFHIEIVISATEMLGGSGTCSPQKFWNDWCNLVGFMYYFDQIKS